MSRQNCSLYVDANGRYCCTRKVFRVTDRAYTISTANTGPLNLMMFPTGDTDEVSVLHSVIQPGATAIVDAGTYILDVDCDALDGTVAPTEVALQMAACCEPILHGSQTDAALLVKMCALLEAAQSTPGNLASIIADLKALITQTASTNTKLEAICDKLLDNISALEKLAEGSSEQAEALAELCKKVLAQTEATQKATEAAAQSAAANAQANAEQLTCLKQIKAGQVAAATAATAAATAAAANAKSLGDLAKAIADLKKCNTDENTKQQGTLEELLAELRKPDCFPVTLYQLTPKDGLDIEKSWIDGDAVAGGAAVGTDYKTAFTGTDIEGYPAHPNAPTSTTQTPGAVTTNTANPGAQADQKQSDFYLCPPTGVTLVESFPTVEAVGIWASGNCSETMTEILNAPNLNAGTNNLGFFPKGIYRFRLYMHDPSFSGLNFMQYLVNGVVTRIPGSWISSKPIVATPIQAFCCTDGKYYNKDLSEELVLSDTLVLDNPCGSGCVTC